MNVNIVVGIVFIVAFYDAVLSLSSGKDDERRAVKMVPMKNMSNRTLQDILRVTKSLSSDQDDERRVVKMVPTMKSSNKIWQYIQQAANWHEKLQECDVSLPQKANLVCKLGRALELCAMEHIWKLKDSSYGFALLDGEWSWILILSDFLNPFTRFYLEGYLQTVLTTNLGLDIYKRLVNKIPEKETNHDISYQKLAKFFEMSAEFGGVYNRRPSKYEAFIDDKTKWISDQFFTQQRLAGVNPMSLRRVTLEAGPVGLDWDTLYKTLNTEFDWKGAVQKALGTHDTLEEAIKQGRVYVLRYELCDDLPKEKDLTDSDPNRTMWETFSPIALFASAENIQTKTNNLVPVAIQMDHTPDSAVYTPEDDGNWMLAKLNVQVTDLGYAQIVEHLAKVHFLMEPFCVILKRTLSSAHPLHQMLKYHCRDVTVPNTIGAPTLVNDAEFMDQLFAFGNGGTIRLLTDAHPLTTWDVTDFRNEIKKRGVDDKELLPYYPYRDDGEQILKIIEKMVKEYVDLYYDDDEDVQNDREFKKYLYELRNYGKIQGLPSKIDTKDELCDIVTRIISQLSVQHAAVNYPLSDYAEYTPNLPTKLYNDTRVKEGEFSELRLPNGKTSIIEASFSNALALYRFDSLFDYGNELRDPKAVKLVNSYYIRLMNVVQPDMQEKNRKRKEKGFLTYPYLIPRWLPNGIQT